MKKRLTRGAKRDLMSTMIINGKEKDEFLHKYLPVIQDFLAPVKKAKGLGRLAERLGYNQSRLSQFIAGNRQPSRYYVLKFVKGGHISVKQFLQGKNIDDLDNDEQEFWREVMILEDKDLMFWLKKAQANHLNIIGLIKAAIPEEA